jgi:hypothetical protein
VRSNTSAPSSGERGQFGLLQQIRDGLIKKSPGVQLCRGSARGSSYSVREDPHRRGHLIDSAGMVILRLRRVVP